jgi:hypothetical protein
MLHTTHPLFIINFCAKQFQIPLMNDFVNWTGHGSMTDGQAYEWIEPISLSPFLSSKSLEQLDYLLT